MYTACIKSKLSRSIPMSEKLTHFNEAGEAHMVDVGSKAITQRLAVAEGVIEMLPETLAMIVAGDHKKGDVLGIARIAAIMAVKKTPELIPLAHPLALSGIEVEFECFHGNCVRCQVSVKCSGQTGVEIEALNGVQVALLTIYDMCKAVDKGMVIRDVQLLHKSGGKSGTWQREGQ